MAVQWKFTDNLRSASRMQQEEFRDLYEQARRATQEAQRQGDAQLKAAIEAATIVPASSICDRSPTSVLNNTLLASVYCQIACLLLDKKDVMPIVFQFLLRTTLIYFIFQSPADLLTFMKTDFGLWIAALCATVLIMPLQFSSWCQGPRGVVLLLLSFVLWFGEVVAVLATHIHLSLDLVHLLSQCIFSSVLHRATFCSHVKARLFGLGLQTIGTLAMVSKVYDALPAISYFSISHFVGVALAYASDQQFGADNRKSNSHFAFKETRRVLDLHIAVPQTCSQQAPKRALGGFAGGFAGVSSLKCPYPASTWTVSSCRYSGSSEDYVSQEVSCSSFSTVENSSDSLSSKQCFSGVSSLNGGLSQASDTVHSAVSGLDCNVYWAAENHIKRQF